MVRSSTVAHVHKTDSNRRTRTYTKTNARFEIWCEVAEVGGAQCPFPWH
jgi:hypothetical protein